AAGAEFEDVPLTQIRAAIARRMPLSKAPVPHFYVASEVAMDHAWELREQLNTLEGQPKISVNDLVIRACALALLKHPGVNASLQGDAIRVFHRAHIGIAVALEDGLITPVLRDCQAKPLAQIAVEARDLVERARNRKLRAQELSGATFSISNLGMFDVTEFSAIINPPEGAILAVGSVRRVTVVDDRPGGVCLNWGCIPTKALLRNAEVVTLLNHAADFGIRLNGFEASYPEAVQRSRRVADRMAKGVEFLFRKNKITLFPGRGTLMGKNVVEVKGTGGAETLEARAVILATGSEPKSLPDVSKELARTFTRRGITLKTGVKVASVKPGGPGAVVDLGGEKLEVEQVLMAVGRAAKVAGLGLEGLGVQLERGFVKVSPTMETSVKGLYAIGDMAGAPLLAHKA